MKHKLLITFFLVFFIQLAKSQNNSEQDFFNRAATYYIFGEYENCSNEIEIGFKIYSNSEKLEAINNKLPKKFQVSRVPKIDEEKQTPPKKTKIRINLQRVPGENKMKWNEKLAEIASKIVIVYDAEIERSYDVTNESNHYYSPGTSDAQGIYTQVKLIITLKDEYKNLFELEGPFYKDSELFKCK